MLCCGQINAHPADWVAFGGRGLVGRFCGHAERHAGSLAGIKKNLLLLTGR